MLGMLLHMTVLSPLRGWKAHSRLPTLVLALLLELRGIAGKDPGSDLSVLLGRLGRELVSEKF